MNHQDQYPKEKLKNTQGERFSDAICISSAEEESPLVFIPEMAEHTSSLESQLAQGKPEATASQNVSIQQSQLSALFSTEKLKPQSIGSELVIPLTPDFFAKSPYLNPTKINTKDQNFPNVNNQFMCQSNNQLFQNQDNSWYQELKLSGNMDIEQSSANLQEFYMRNPSIPEENEIECNLYQRESQDLENSFIQDLRKLNPNSMLVQIQMVVQEGRENHSEINYQIHREQLDKGSASNLKNENSQRSAPKRKVRTKASRKNMIKLRNDEDQGPLEEDQQSFSGEIRKMKKRRNNQKMNSSVDEDPFSIAIDKRKIKNGSSQYSSNSFEKQQENITKQFINLVTITDQRKNPNQDGQFRWKLGTVKKWMTLQDCLKYGFGLYYGQLKRYKRTVKMHLTDSSPKMITRNKAGSIKIQPSFKKQSRNVPKQMNIISNPKYQRELKIIFNDVVTKKLIEYEKNKKKNISHEQSQQNQLESWQLNQQQQSEYIPAIGQLRVLINDVVNESNQRINDKFTPRNSAMKIELRSIQTAKIEQHGASTTQISEKNSNDKYKVPMNTKVIQELNRFQESINYVSEVDQMVGTLRKDHVKLSCLEGLGLRSSHKVQQMTRQEYLQEILASPMRQEEEQITSNQEHNCKSEIFK